MIHSRFPFAAFAIPVGDSEGRAQDHEGHEFRIASDENSLVDSLAHDIREHLLVTPAQGSNALSILRAERHRPWQSQLVTLLLVKDSADHSGDRLAQRQFRIFGRERRDRRQPFDQPAHRVGPDLGEDFLLAAEVVVDVPLGQSALVCDLVHVGRIVAAMRERARRAHQDFAPTFCGFGEVAYAVPADPNRRSRDPLEF